MDRSERIQVATLWFAVLIFLQTGSGGGHPVLSVIAIVAVLLTYLLPLYLLADLVAAMLGD